MWQLKRNKARSIIIDGSVTDSLLVLATGCSSVSVGSQLPMKISCMIHLYQRYVTGGDHCNMFCQGRVRVTSDV